MPLPRPRKGETQKKFISRCMSNDVMNSEFPDEDQRAAVCHSQWRRAKNNSGGLQFNKKSGPRVNRLRHLMASEIREETLDGKEYLVVPTSMIVEGVHNNLMYPASELAKFPDAWNGCPVVIVPEGHPKDEFGNPVTANSPEEFELHRVGYLFNSEWEDPKGRVLSETWLEVAKMNEVDGGETVLKMLRDGENIEVSTGLFTDEIPEEGEWNGEEYEAILVNYRPDHLALLPFDKGACSWEDGAGMLNVNKRGEGQGQGGDKQGDGGTDTCSCPECGATASHKRGVPCTEQKCPKCGASMTGMSGNKEKVADLKALMEKAAELGCSVNILSHGDMYSRLNDEIRQIVKPNVAKGEYVYIRDIFDGFAVYQVESQNQDVKMFRQNYKVDKDDNVTLDGDPTEVKEKREYVPVSNKTHEPEGGNQMDREKTVKALIENKDNDWGEEDREMLMAATDERFEQLTKPKDEPKDNKKKEEPKAEPKDNGKAKDKPKGLKELLEEADPETRGAIQRAVKRDKQIKKEVVKELVENTACDFTEEELEGKDLDELEKLANLAQVDVDFSGRSIGNMDDDEDDDEVPAAPSLSDAIKENYQKKNA